MYPEEGKSLIAACEFDAKPEARVYYVKVNEEDQSWERLPDRDVSDYTNIITNSTSMGNGEK